MKAKLIKDYTHKIDVLDSVIDSLKEELTQNRKNDILRNKLFAQREKRQLIFQFTKDLECL